MWGLNPNACVEMSVLACHLLDNAQERVDTLSHQGWKKAKGLSQSTALVRALQGRLLEDYATPAKRLGLPQTLHTGLTS